MKKLLFTLMLLPVVANARTETLTPFSEATKKGINFVSVKNQGMPASTEQINEKGYRETSGMDEAIIHLLQTKQEAGQQIVAYRNSSNPADSHLHAKASEIMTGFNFIPVPGIPEKNILGFAAAGSYHQNGWDGMAEIFSFQDDAICKYSTFRIEKVIIDEVTENLVNGKPAGKDIAGNDKTGFMYLIEWFNPDRRMSIECASRKFDPKLMTAMLEKARQVDNQK